MTRLTIPILALVVVLSAASARAVECRLSSDGSVASWLLTRPFPLDPKAGFAKDLLPEKAGERSGAARAEEPDGVVAWAAEVTPAGFLDLSSRCLAHGESVFYAACELTTTRAGAYTLNTAYWSQIAVWLDGKPVLEGAGESTLLLPRKSAEIKLERGKTHHLLVKVASKSRQAFLKVSVSGDDIGPGSPVTCVLRVPEARVGELLVQAIQLAAQAGNVVQVGKQVELLAHAPAGCPVLDGEVELRAALIAGPHRVVREFERAKLAVKDLPGGAISMPWTVPDATDVPKYVIEADVFYAGKKIGRVEKTFYVAEGLAAWGRLLGERLGKAELQIAGRDVQPDVAFARLKLEKSLLFARGDDYTGPQPGKMVDELEACAAAVARIEKHEKRAAERGLSEHAYTSSIDDAPQPYYVYVPQKHDGKTRLPCIVYLHGYNPDLNKLNWELIPRELLDYCDRDGYYLVAPFARSNTDFQGVGETDVIEVFEMFAQAYPIDPDRVFLLGYSMGAMGAFTIGAHYPDLWAGLVSVSGRADYYLWKDYDREKVEPYKRLLLDTEFGAEMIGNYRNLPILMYHGGADSLIKTEQSRRLHARLKALGGDVTFNELPGEDHWIMSRVLEDDPVFKWMAPKRRDRWPHTVDFTTGTIKYRAAYWVTVIEPARGGEPIAVRAALNPEKTRLDVKTQNIASLRLDLAKELVGEKPALVVSVNGKEQKIDKPGPATFDVEESKRAGALRKTPRLCGPVKEALNRRFILVAGLDEKKDGDDERFKQQLMGAASEWYNFTKSVPLVKRDADVAAADVEHANLVLLGEPANNAKLKEIAAKLPIRITDEGFVLPAVGGQPEKTYSNKDHGLVMIYPNPLNPAKYVVVRSGLAYGRTLSPNHKYDLLPDFVIFTAGTDYDDTDKAVVAGFFDENWQLADRLIWRRGEKDPDPRRTAAAP